jgi:hypothetical protein
VCLEGRLEVGQLSPFEVKTAAVLFGDVFVFNILRECGVDILRGEDENLGYSDGVKPSLDPAPDGGKEARCADNL